MHRSAWLFAVVLISFVAAPGLRGQGGPPQKPGPEHEKLGYFVGKWTSEGEMKESPFGPGGKVTATDNCEWFEGRFAVVCRSEGKGPTGPTKGIGIMGYNADQKVYTYYGIDNTAMVMASVPHGTVQGDTWTYTDESMMGGQKMKSRFVIKTQSPTSYSFTWEMQGSDGKWMPVMQGTSKKAQ
jgi:hypothetical protein